MGKDAAGGIALGDTDELDLHEVLSCRLYVAEVIALKVRCAVETGVAPVSVRDLNVSVCE